MRRGSSEAGRRCGGGDDAREEGKLCCGPLESVSCIEVCRDGSRDEGQLWKPWAAWNELSEGADAVDTTLAAIDARLWGVDEADDETEPYFDREGCEGGYMVRKR
jgi:hypothetical protein